MSSNGKQAAVIGGGTMGADIAAVFAAAGWGVHIAEPSETIRESLSARLSKAVGQISKETGKYAVRTYPETEALPWRDISFVVECVPEDLSVKQAVFRKLEALSPPSIPLTSNSSSFPISRIGQGLETQSRMVGLHFFLPAHLVPLVEVVRSSRTDPAVADTIGAVMRQVGKHPVQVMRDVPGFLANRLQHALMREALYLVETGVGSAEDVDAAVRFGFGFRFLAAGPMLQKDLSGLHVHRAAAASIYPDLCNATEPSRIISDLVSAGHLGIKTGKGFYPWTDETIAREKERYDGVLMAALALLKE